MLLINLSPVLFVIIIIVVVVVIVAVTVTVTITIIVTLIIITIITKCTNISQDHTMQQMLQVNKNVFSLFLNVSSMMFGACRVRYK